MPGVAGFVQARTAHDTEECCKSRKLRRELCEVVRSGFRPVLGGGYVKPTLHDVIALRPLWSES